MDRVQLLHAGMYVLFLFLRDCQLLQDSTATKEVLGKSAHIQGY